MTPLHVRLLLVSTLAIVPGPVLASPPVPNAPAAEAPAEPRSFALRDGDRVVFYGDSITQAGGYGHLVEAYVTTRFPRWKVVFENAGVGGDTVRGGWAGPVELRLRRDVVARKPTVVTVMLGMNDGGYERFDPMTLSAFAQGYSALVRSLKQELPGARLTLIRSSPFDDVSRPPQFQPGYDDALRRLGCYVETLARREGATLVDFRTPLNTGLANLLEHDPGLARMILPDRVHPSAAGHLVMGAALLRAWGAPGLVARVEIDAAGPRASAVENAEVTALAAVNGGLAWTQLDGALPLPLGFDDAEVQLAERAGADLESLDTEPLVVRGLSPGRYELEIDSKKVGTFSAEALAAGINLARLDTPQRWQGFAARWSIEDSHHLQLLRRRLLAGAGEDPKVQAAISVLDAQDEAARAARREAVRPRPRRYELRPVRSVAAADGGSGTSS
jgi:lysophospholipase L1-like esterase